MNWPGERPWTRSCESEHGSGVIVASDAFSTIQNADVNLLYRGNDFEGHWFRTTPEWTTHAQSVIEKAGK
jgi:hypothetical protein